MKKLYTLFAIALVVMCSSCSKFDDSAIWDKLNEQKQTLIEHEKRIAALEELCKQMNTNISSLQTIVNALQQNDYITSVIPINQNGTVIGYTIAFAKSGAITIYHGTDGKDGADGTNGKDGKDGYTPQIGVKKDSDGIYYWTLDGAWLTDANGNKIKAVGMDGKDGQDGKPGANGEDGEDGEDGKDGADGKDGITPQLKIEDDYWYVSYDNGQTWIQLGKATGEDGENGADGSDGADGANGKDGDSIFSSVTQDDEFVYFNLSDGTMITLPKHDRENIQFEDLNVKAICCKNWDTNNDGELSYAEAAAVTDIGTVFSENTNIVAFNELKYFTGLTTIAESAFRNCECLWKVSIPENIKHICDKAFQNCTALAKISFSEQVEKIGKSAFDNCAELKKIDWSENIVLVDDYAFNDCINIAELILPNSIETIGNYAFYGCISALNIKFPENILSIGVKSFYGCENLESLTVDCANPALALGEKVFGLCAGNLYWNCIVPDDIDWFVDSKFSTITFGEKVKRIGNSAFYEYGESLKTINLPNSLESIGKTAFYGCSGVEELIVPNSVTSIESSAFRFCSSLNNVILSNQLKVLTLASFSNCTNLTSVNLSENLEIIEDNVFLASAITSISIPEKVTSIGMNAFGKNLTIVYCKPTIPPAISYRWPSTGKEGSFPLNNDALKIYVPQSVYSEYAKYTSSFTNTAAVANWSLYASFLEPYIFE